MRLVKSGLFCYMFLFVSGIDAQQIVGNYIVHRYTDENGLPGDNCYKVLIDKQNNVWVTTSSGISRFDGHGFTNYSCTNGLGGMAVYDLRMDDAGSIYCFSEKNIQYYTGNEIRPFSTSLYTVPDTITETMLPAGRGCFLFGGAAHPGLFLAANHQLRQFANITDHIYYLEQDCYGYIYAASREQRIWILKDLKLQGVIEMPKKEQASFGTAISPDGKFWYTNCRYIYQIRGQHIVRTIPIAGDNKNSGIYVGKNNNCFLFEADTLYQYQDNHWRQIRLPIRFGYINDLKEDENGTLWLATTQGLYSIRTNPAASRQGKRTLYFSKSGNKVLLNPQPLRKCDRSQPPGYSYCYTAANGITWYCTPDNGLHYTNPTNHKPTRYIAPDASKSIKNDKLFLKAVEDNKGRVWFSSYNGIDCYANGQFKHYGTNEGLAIRAIYDLVVDGAGQVYAGNNGLFVYHNDRFRQVLKSGFGKTTIYSLAVDSRGNLWAMSEAGKIYKMNCGQRNDSPTDSIDIAGLLHTMSVKGLQFDLKDNLWVATNRYLVIIQPDADGKYASGKMTALPTLIEENGKLTCGIDGDMYFYNRKGTLLHINTDSALHAALTISNVSVPYFTSITTLRNNGKTASLPYQGEGSYQKSTELISYSHNSIELRFATTSLLFPREVKFRFMLKGLDQGWQPPQTTRSAKYVNIPPGSYTFMVQAADHRNNWTLPISFTFTVSPPWYRTWWGYLLIAAAVALAAYGLFYWGLNLSRRRNTIQRLLTEQQLKTLRAQMSPHFLHNIFAFLARKLQEDNTLAVDSLTTLSNYVREVLYATDKAVVSLEDEILFTEKYFRIQQLLLNCVFTYKITVKNNVDTLGLKVPSMLLQPIVENACKYGIDKKKNDNLIHLTIDQSADYVCCSLIDTGSTNPKPPLHPNYTSKGLTLTKERLLLLYKDCKKESFISMLSNDQGGMTVSVYLPLC